MLDICPENVERLCSIDCSSPMSANTCSNTLSSVPRSAGTWSPAQAIRVNSPTVFRVTVFPPVFGPVMISSVNSSPSHRLPGTTLSGSISGCRPRIIFRYPWSFNLGCTAFIRLESMPRAKIWSSSARVSISSSRSEAYGAISWLSAYRILAIS